jgi:predicted  nucleic acid-binding Zn-ribbon protein
MDIKKMGEKVSQALALQGMVDGLEEKVGSLKSKVTRLDGELGKVDDMKKARQEAFDSLTKTEAELVQAKADLDTRLADMKKDGIELPLGKKQVVSGRL